MDFPTLVEDFVRQGVYLKGWSRKTVRTYRQGLNAFQQSFDEPINFTKTQLDAFVIHLRQRGLTPGGCNMYIRTVNSFLSWLKEEQHVPNDLKPIKLLPNPSKPLQGLTEQELRLLLAFRPTTPFELRTFTLIQFLLDTGCRIDEALTLTPDKCDLDNLAVLVTGKGSKQRQVPISLELRKSLFRYVKSRKQPAFFFCTHNGSQLSYRNTYRDIKTVCDKAGVRGKHIHPHSFRHYFAVSYIRKGGDIYRLSRILGHTTVQTTAIYLRSMGIEHLQENHSRLSPLSRI